MKVTEDVYALPQKLELGENSETIYPVAIDTGEGLVLVDAGLPSELETVRENLSDHGFSLNEVEMLILTHQDFDHCGCAASLLQETEATVLAHTEDAPAIDGREEPLKGEERYEAVDIDIELSGGETITRGGKELEVMHTPGHTPGHVSLILDDLLISGDILNVEETGFAGPRERFTPDMESCVEGLNRLSFQEFSKVHCFHGGTAEKDSGDVRKISESLSSEFKGFQKTATAGPARFLRGDLENQEVGLSVFEIPQGETHGAKQNPEMGHQHETETEIYYFREGSGTFRIGSREESYTEGDAFLVKPYKLRRIDAEAETEVLVAGAPVADGVHEGELD
jgi:glyoxylase-like metal-dependent hydrolase (beta-lactamase superfamily II)